VFHFQSRSNAAMAQSDVDATYFELEQAALEQSLQTHTQHEHGKKKRASSPIQDGNEERLYVLPDDSNHLERISLTDTLPAPTNVSDSVSTQILR
jgi:hypothetical protein